MNYAQKLLDNLPYPLAIFVIALIDFAQEVLVIIAVIFIIATFLSPVIVGGILGAMMSTPERITQLGRMNSMSGLVVGLFIGATVESIGLCIVFTIRDKYRALSKIYPNRKDKEDV